MDTTKNTPIRAVSLFLILSCTLSVFGESYVIKNEEYEITGRTKESAITGILGNVTGKTFTTRQALEEFARRQRQKLENVRVFKKSEVLIVYPVAQESVAIPDEIPVTLKVLVEDGNPVSPIPYAFYNSNDGFQAGLLLSMPNVAGSMQNLTIVGLYTAPPDEKNNLRWTNPNYMFLCAWNGIRLGTCKLSLSGNAMKMENDVDDRGTTGLTYEELRVSGSAALMIPFTERFSETLSARITGSPESSIVSVSDPALLSYGPQLRSFKANDTFAYEQLDWEGNFRDGCRASTGFGITQTEPRYADTTTDVTGDAEFAAYRILNDRFNPSIRVSAFAKTGKSDLVAGRNVRGIRNTCMKGTSGVFVNTGIQTKLFRFGEAELHLTPSLDFGCAYANDADDYKIDYGFATGGELMLIFDTMKTLPIKLGMAYDLRPSDRVENSNRLEVDFSFTFSY